MSGSSIILYSPIQLQTAHNRLDNMPLDGSMEVVFRKYLKPSSYEQQKRMFGFVMRDVADQAWLDGKQHNVAWWHFFFKMMLLPEGYVEGETHKDYVKWIELDNGDRHMVGSTKKLNTKGHTRYMEAVEAMAASEYGVRFNVP